MRWSNFQVVCDFPGCEEDAHDGDFAASSEWLILDDGRDYCPGHVIDDPDDEDRRIPAPDTFEWQIDAALAAITSRSIWQLERICANLRSDSWREQLAGGRLDKPIVLNATWLCE